MKIITYSLFLSLVFLFSCQSENVYDRSIGDENFVELSSEGDMLGNLALPAGTKIYKQELAQGQNFTFVFPENLELVVKDISGNHSVFTEISYSCTCQGTGKASVIKALNQYGCLQNTCIGETIGTRKSDLKELSLNVANHNFRDKI